MAQSGFWIGTSWKMNKTRPEARAYAERLAGAAVAKNGTARLFVIPPFTAIADVAALLQPTPVRVGAQNMHWADAGAWTGEISAAMIKECGATLVEIGHSERRQFFGDTDETVSLKVAAAVRHGLTALVCVGETHAQYAAKQTAAVVVRQVQAALSRIGKAAPCEILLAYEPVWSIGEKGTPAPPAFVAEQHARIKAVAGDILGRGICVLYGGSVSPANAAALARQPHVDGLFVGRAAWSAEGYIGLIEHVTAARATPA